MIANDPIDPAYYEELQDRLRVLLRTTNHLFSTDQVALIEELVDANECGVALDMICEVIGDPGTQVDPTVRTDVDHLVQMMALHPGQPASELHECPVCGYGGLHEPAWAGGVASDEICPSCGTHFGYDDDLAGGDAGRRQARHQELRERWESSGRRWLSRSRPRGGMR